MHRITIKLLVVAIIVLVLALTAHNAGSEQGEEQRSTLHSDNDPTLSVGQFQPVDEQIAVYKDTLSVSMRSQTYDPDDYIRLLYKYDWNVEHAKKIMMCESGGNPNAVGDKDTEYFSYGLMQIRALPDRPEPEWLLVPENNIKYAYQIWLQEGKRFGTTGGWYNCGRIKGVL
jgi:hypothetical protein